MVQRRAAVTWLFCENDTNVKRLFNIDGAGPFKDGFNDYLVHGDEQAVRRDAGTKAGAHVSIELGAAWPRRGVYALASAVGAR